MREVPTNPAGASAGAAGAGDALTGPPRAPRAVVGASTPAAPPRTPSGPLSSGADEASAPAPTPTPTPHAPMGARPAPSGDPWFPSMQDAFWWFACERQLMFERRRRGTPPPWTSDPTLARHRFTNAYRAEDRVSQYLINDVQYVPSTLASDAPDEVAFRTLLFRMFNQIGTYEALTAALGEHPSLRTWDPDRYGDILTGYAAHGGRIWNNAYMMTGTLNEPKHVSFLRLLGRMNGVGLFGLLPRTASYRGVFTLLRSFRLIADFLAMQYACDLNYSTVVDFDENDFVVAGLGAVRGLEKLGMAADPEASIRRLTASQETEFGRLGLSFPWLAGSRRLHLIDVQNLLCEFDKWTREAIPGAVAAHARRNAGQRARIKQKFDASAATAHAPIVYRYPPKWNLEPPWCAGAPGVLY